MREIMSWNCPRCGGILAAPSETSACPACSETTGTQEVTTKQIVITGLLLGGLSVLAALFWS